MAQSLVQEASWTVQGASCHASEGLEEWNQVTKGEMGGGILYFYLLHCAVVFVSLYLELSASTEFQIDSWHLYSI